VKRFRKKIGKGKMEYSALARKIVDLRIAARLACMCEDGDKALLSLKTKFLYVLYGKDCVSPPEIMARLRILKPNLTTLAKALERENLICRSRTLLDRRGISYSLTERGQGYLDERLARIAENLKGIYDTQMEYDAAADKISDVLDFLSFLQC
jgi:DNA-binding MarR family transcriptional regulator